MRRPEAPAAPLGDIGARFGLVVPAGPASRIFHAVTRGGEPVVVKLEADPAGLGAEVRALRHWNGRGALRVVDVDNDLGAVVLERAIPGTRLRAAEIPDSDAAAIAAGVIGDLHAAAPPLPELPHIETWTSRLDRRGSALAEDLLRRSSGEVALHGDLHHDNILRHADRWVAIDPKGVLGPPEAEPAAFLRNPRGELLAHLDPVGITRARVEEFTRVLGHDPELVLDWAVVLCQLAADWALDDGEGRQEAARWRTCAAILGEARSGG